VSDDCECGSHGDRTTPSQALRTFRTTHIIDDWTASAASEDPSRMFDSLALLHHHLHQPPCSAQVTTIRMTDLVTTLARRCAALLPKRFDDLAAWIVEDGQTGELVDIDHTDPEARLAVRLEMAYARSDEVLARDLILGYLRGVPPELVNDQLGAIFMCLTQNYQWAVRHQHRADERRKGSAAVTRSKEDPTRTRRALLIVTSVLSLPVITVRRLADKATGRPAGKHTGK